MATFYSPKIVTDGLVLVLDAGNSKSYPGSGTTWIDLTGNGNVGTLANGPTFNSANGGSIVFDGVDDIITTPTSSVQFLTTGVTISVTLLYNQTTTNDNVISWGNGAFNGGTSNSWELRIRGAGSVEFAPGRLVGAESTPRRLQYVPSPALNQRIATLDVTYTANGIAYFYENGILKSQQDYTGVGTDTSTKSIRVGRGTDTHFPGNIYNIKIYNRALIASEVQQNFNALRSRFGI